MGWTSTDEYERFHKPLFTIREYLDARFVSDHPDYPRHDVLDSAMHGKTEYYAAIQATDRSTGKTTVFALIVMVKYDVRAHDGYTLAWKEMSEASMPYLFNCPARIIAKLDAPANPQAAEWRQKCREHRAKKREAAQTLKNGTIIRFETPLRFTHGIERQQFTVEREGRTLRFRGEDGVLCRIPKAAAMKFEMVRASA